MFDIIMFKSPPKNNFFAPEWTNYMVEIMITEINNKKLSSFLRDKEKDILKLKAGGDGYTGLKNHTTSRHPYYNVFNFKLNEIKKLKKQIINLHTSFLQRLNLPPVESLYIKGWFNVMKKNEKIKAHAHGVHPDIYLGGHFCVDCKNTSTYYMNPINQLNVPEVYKSKNEPGKLTLFQNFIPHYTDKHRGETKRVTIAFDLSLIKKDNAIKLNLKE